MSRRKHALAPCHVTTIKNNSVRKIQRELGAAILAFFSLQSCPMLSKWYEWENTFHNSYQRTSCRDSTYNKISKPLEGCICPLDSLRCRVDKHFLQSYDSTTITWGLLLTSQATKLLSPINKMHFSTRLDLAAFFLWRKPINTSYCYFRSFLCLSHYLEPLPLHKM